MGTIRDDVGVNCRPLGGPLPQRATVGLVCMPARHEVGNVSIYAFEDWDGQGTYSFDDWDGALTAYQARVTNAGVAPRSGDCVAGVPGDKTWYREDELDLHLDRADWYGWLVDGYPYLAGRIGCFTDTDGRANVLLTCPSGRGDVLVAIVGTTADITGLVRFAYEGSERGDLGGEPWICLGSDDIGP